VLHLDTLRRLGIEARGRRSDNIAENEIRMAVAIDIGGDRRMVFQISRWATISTGVKAADDNSLARCAGIPRGAAQ